MFTPNDPMTDLRSAAVAMHELYRELRNAGFNSKEAVHLVGQVMVAGVQAAETESNE